MQALLERIGEKKCLDFHDLHLTTLKLQLENCDREIGVWLTTAQNYRPTDGKESKKWFRRFWAAFNQSEVKNLSTNICQRRSELALALSILGM